MALLDDALISNQLSSIKKKFFLLLLTCVASAFGYWALIRNNITDSTIENGLGWAMLICPFLFFILYLNIEKLKSVIAQVSFVVAISLGVFLGCLSGVFEGGASGVVLQSVILVFLSVSAIVFFYKNGMIKVDNRFLEMTAATFSVVMASVTINFIMSIVMLGWQNMYSGSTGLAIGLTFVVLALALMVTTIELNIVDKRSRAYNLTPEDSWGMALDLLVDVAWVYGAVLFLLMKIRGRKSN